MSSTLYHLLDSALTTAFNYVNQVTGAAVTGKVQGDFTIELAKDGTGNQSLTGITITEVDSTNNAGLYKVVVSTSGFVSAAGTYELVIYDTADPDKRWEETVVVTTQPVSSLVAVTFAATASDGRIMDGASPVNGATLTFKSPDGVYRFSTTSNSSGLWTIILDQAGVWTVYVTKSAYAQTSFTITVSGSTATGPGADVSITAISGSSATTASEVWAYARRQARDRVGTKADTEIKELVNEALFDLATCTEWEYYQSYDEIVLNAAYDTGTVAITNASTTVTLTGGTWPSWAAYGEIYIGSFLYKVASRTSDSVIVLETAFQGTTDSAATYALYCSSYTMPTDLLRMGNPIVGNFLSDADKTSFEEIQRSKYMGLRSSSWPEAWAFSKGRLYIYPFASESRPAAFAYYRRPAELTSGSDIVDVERNHLTLLYRIIDKHVCIRYGTTAGGMDFARAEAAVNLELGKTANANRTQQATGTPLASGGVRRGVARRWL